MCLLCMTFIAILSNRNRARTPNFHTFIDTDSFIYQFKTDDFYQTMKDYSAKFDASNYPMDNRFNIMPANQMKPGLFKVEMKSKVIAKYIQKWFEEQNISVFKFLQAMMFSKMQKVLRAMSNGRQLSSMIIRIA